MPCSSTAISAASCIAPTTAGAHGPNCRRRPFRPTPPARRRCSRCGRWRPAAPMKKARCGPARCRPGCSAPTTAAKAGSQVSALWNVPEREKWFGGGYDDAGIHIDLARSARFPPRGGRDLLRRRLGYARRRRQLDAARRGAGRGLYAARAGRRRRRRRIRTAWCAAPPRPTSCGCSITAASSARPTPALRGRNSSRRATISALPLRRIRAQPAPPGSCPRSRTRCALPRDGALAVTRTQRRRQDLAEPSARVCRNGRLRPDLPPRPRRRRHRRPARHGLDHRRPVGER